MYKVLRILNRNYTNTRLCSYRMSKETECGPVEHSIRRKIKDLLKPSHLDVINESYMHNVPKGAETHFKVIVVSELFKDKLPIARHRMINEALQSELESDVHALSIVARTPEQWEESNKKVPQSPACGGGFGK